MFPDALTFAQAFHEHLQQRTGALLPVTLWNGIELGPREADFRLILKSESAIRAVSRWPPGLHFGRAYVQGFIEVEGEIVSLFHELDKISRMQLRLSDLNMLMFLARTLPKIARPPRLSAGRTSRMHGRLHSRERDRSAVEFHYDLPIEFFHSFLGESMVYSCAYFRTGDESLELAQVQKLDLICRKLRVDSRTVLLDVGCGWGGLVIHAAKTYGARAVGVTLSKSQAEFAVKHVEREGLCSAVTIIHGDYRDVTGTYDAIASVGMLEHVGPRNLDGYISILTRRLRPGGLMLNHGVVFGKRDRIRKGTERTFLTEYVFPDGGLVPAWRLLKSVQTDDLQLVDLEQLRSHYSLTLRHWLSNLEANHYRSRGADRESNYRVWRLYMAMCAYGFDCGELSVVQILTEKHSGVRSTGLSLDRWWLRSG